MRIVAILICLAAMVGVGWHAVMRGTGQEMLRGAPQIQKIVHEDTRAAVLPLASHPIEIRTDGRNVRLSGPVNSESERQTILKAVASTRFVTKVDDALRVLPTADPYLFHVIREQGGDIVLSGHVPTARIHETLIEQARSLFDGAMVSDRLVMAAAVPDGDWLGMAQAGLAALAELREGQIQVSGTHALISGTTSDANAGQRLIRIVNAAPLGDWQVQIAGVLPVAEKYTFSALKMADGSVIVDGNAPDEIIRDDLLVAAGAISSRPVAGSLELAEGMPSLEWPDTVKAGIAALALTANGLLGAENSVISLTAEVVNDDDLARLLPLLESDWVTEISVQNPTPAAFLEISLLRDGSLSVAGLLPEGMDSDQLVEALPGITRIEIDPTRRGRPAEWLAPFEGLEIVLPRFESATVNLTGKSVSVAGKLKRGFSADGARAALRSALERDWTLELDLVESAPLAELVLSKSENEIALSGVLPSGLGAEDALSLLGEAAGGEGLSGGGEGDPLAWTGALTAARFALARFADATGVVSEGQIDLSGRLLPGYPVSEMQEWLSRELPEGWSVGLSADEIEPSEGDQRVSLHNGEAQNFRQGFWLPNVDFEVSPDRCKQEIETALSVERIVFVTGSARLDQKGTKLLNRLAAIAVRCLNSSVIALQISGHTDSVGNDENNLKLSQERADAVRDALLRRGVRADAMTASGYGESEPIATNDTADGRAQNRRITFGWSARTN